MKKIYIPRSRLAPSGKESITDILTEVTTMAGMDHQNIVRYHHSWIETEPRKDKKESSE